MKTPQLRLLIKEIVKQLIPEEVILGNINVDIDTLKRLKKAYNKAVKEKKESFLFNGNPIVTELAKHAITHMSYRLNLIKEEDSIIDITFDRTCPICKKVNSVTVKKKDYDRWRAGTLIQNAFPYLKPDEREILKTGICNSCWDKMFKDI
jgi:hypothetical protein